MTRKEQNKILDAKIKSNINQYKVDRLNAEISAFSSGNLNKYEFLTRKDLKYKPNALDKAKFEFSPLGKAFSMGLDKTAQGYQDEGVIKLLKDIRDALPGGVNIRPKDNRADDRFDNDGFDDNDSFNDFDIYGRHKDTKNKYNLNGFDIKGIHRVINTFLNKENDIRKDISKNINWLKDKNEFLKLYNEIIKNGEFSETINKKVISSNIFKHFLENILSGNTKDNEAEDDYIRGIVDFEKKLNKSKKGKKINKLKDYAKKLRNSIYGKHKEKIKTDQAKSFEDQKGKGYVNLPIALSKIYTNNSSKELINNIKQLINYLYDTKQVTKQVYSNLIKTITYK